MALHFIHGVQAISHCAQMKSLEDHLILRKSSCNRSSTNMEHEPTRLSPGACSCPCCIPAPRETGPEAQSVTAQGSQHRLRPKVTALKKTQGRISWEAVVHITVPVRKNEIIHPKVDARKSGRCSSGPAGTKENFLEHLQQNQLMSDKAFVYRLVLCNQLNCKK